LIARARRLVMKSRDKLEGIDPEPARLETLWDSSNGIAFAGA
jgi:hypothetical protein